MVALIDFCLKLKSANNCRSSESSDRLRHKLAQCDVAWPKALPLTFSALTHCRPVDKHVRMRLRHLVGSNPSWEPIYADIYLGMLLGSASYLKALAAEGAVRQNLDGTEGDEVTDLERLVAAINLLSRLSAVRGMVREASVAGVLRTIDVPPRMELDDAGTDPHAG